MPTCFFRYCEILSWKNVLVCSKKFTFFLQICAVFFFGGIRWNWTIVYMIYVEYLPKYMYVCMYEYSISKIEYHRENVETRPLFVFFSRWYDVTWTSVLLLGDILPTRVHSLNIFTVSWHDPNTDHYIDTQHNIHTYIDNFFCLVLKKIRSLLPVVNKCFYLNIYEILNYKYNTIFLVAIFKKIYLAI